MEGSPKTDGGIAAPAPPFPPRCVLWHDPIAGAPAEDTVGQLEARLRARGVGVVRARSGAAAMAELCVLARDGRTTEGPAPGPLSVVIVEPADRSQAGALAHAIERYIPHAVVWAFQPGPSPTLRPASPDEILGWPGGTEPPPEPRVVVTATSDSHEARRPGEPVRLRARPELKLAGGPADPDVVSAPRDDEPRDAMEDAPEKSNARQLLTQEELTMLLADDLPGPAHQDSP